MISLKFSIEFPVFLVLAVTVSGVSAQEKSVLTEHYVRGPFRIFYAIDGKSAVPPADQDSSGVPDHVEDVAKQLWGTRELFCTVLKFPDPLQSERYDGVDCVEIYIRERSEIGGGNGVAFENPQRAKKIDEGKPDDRTLVMALGKHVDATKNGTPSHEFFHLIQYSTTYFKNSWYLEGMTRWSEHALHTDGIGEIKYSPRGPWPQKTQHLPILFDMSYDAEHVLWNPIAVRTDPKGVLPEKDAPLELQRLQYSDGTPVIRDPLLNGAALMRDILTELAKQDDIAFETLGYKDWSEDNQRSPQNNPFIYQAVMDALRKHTRPVGRFDAKTFSR
ncbi:hypothetical protein GC176_08310 [bacterium]|nr:hypothetical protein [bacterium]